MKTISFYLLLFISFPLYVLAQKSDTLTYFIITKDSTSFFQVLNISDVSQTKKINHFLYENSLVDTSQKGSYANSRIIYNRNGFLTVYREGNYDYWMDGTWIGYYSETHTMNIKTGKLVGYEDLFNQKDTNALRKLVWKKAEEYSFSTLNPKEYYRITEDVFRVSAEGIFFEIGLNCGRGPCLGSEVPVIIPFRELKHYLRKGCHLK